MKTLVIASLSILAGEFVYFFKDAGLVSSWLALGNVKRRPENIIQTIQSSPTDPSKKRQQCGNSLTGITLSIVPAGLAT